MLSSGVWWPGGSKVAPTRKAALKIWALSSEGAGSSPMLDRLTIPMVPRVGPLVSAFTSASSVSRDFRSIRERCSAAPTLDPIALALLLVKIPKLFPPTLLTRPTYPSSPSSPFDVGLADYASTIVTYPSWP